MKMKEFFGDVDADRPELIAKAHKERKELFDYLDSERPWTAEMTSF